MQGNDTDAFKIQNYSDPIGFSSNVRSFSRNPHVRGKQIENAGPGACAKTLTRLLMENGILTSEESFERVRRDYEKSLIYKPAGLIAPRSDFRKEIGGYGSKSYHRS